MSWFASWFDSPYYHLLYQHRNTSEAAFFISNLLEYLKMPKGARILDLACGKGRHSIYLNQQGYEVVGADLSPESIAAANEQANDTLQFVVHDMRKPIGMGDFDAVFNLFTSFGYFETEAEHLETLASAKTTIAAREGYLVIDFMNAYKTIQNLVLEETKTVRGIDFQLRRFVENGYIVKEIGFNDQGQDYRFAERVRAFLLSDFEAMFERVGLRLQAHFGSFSLDAFDAALSDRLILIATPC